MRKILDRIRVLSARPFSLLVASTAAVPILTAPLLAVPTGYSGNYLNVSIARTRLAYTVWLQNPSKPRTYQYVVKKAILTLGMTGDHATGRLVLTEGSDFRNFNVSSSYYDGRLHLKFQLSNFGASASVKGLSASFPIAKVETLLDEQPESQLPDRLVFEIQNRREAYGGLYEDHNEPGIVAFRRIAEASIQKAAEAVLLDTEKQDVEALREHIQAGHYKEATVLVQCLDNARYPIPADTHRKFTELEQQHQQAGRAPSQSLPASVSDQLPPVAEVRPHSSSISWKVLRRLERGTELSNCHEGLFAGQKDEAVDNNKYIELVLQAHNESKVDKELQQVYATTESGRRHAPDVMVANCTISGMGKKVGSHEILAPDATAVYAFVFQVPVKDRLHLESDDADGVTTTADIP